jgi:hypothetical protein
VPSCVGCVVVQHRCSVSVVLQWLQLPARRK